MIGLVEWLTHALLGAIVAEWFLGKRLGNVAWQWGALLGIAPDLLELPPTLFINTRFTLWWLQGPLHSLAMAALVAWLLSPRFAKFWKKQKVTRSIAAWWLFATWASNGLLDALTVEGTAIFWPFPLENPMARTSFNLVQTLGPVPALIMALTLGRMVIFKTKKTQAARHRALVWGSGLTTAWFVFCLTLKLICTAGFNTDLKRRGTHVIRRMETPVGFNLLLRRAIVEGDKDFRVGYRSLFESFSSPVRWTIYPREPLTLIDSKEIKALTNHTHGWSIARNHSQGAWLADLRYCENRVWGEKKGMVDSRFPRTWNILPAARGDKVLRLHDPRHDPKESRRRMRSRTLGNRSDWEANPRLAGVTGRLPDFLFVEE